MTEQQPPPQRRGLALGAGGTLVSIAVIASTVVVGGAGLVYYRDSRAQLEAERERADREEARRKVVEALLERMTEERVVADVVVIDQKHENGKLWTTIRLHMKPPPSGGEPRTYGPYTVEGDIVYFEAYVLRFEDKFIHAADEKKGRALMLLTRVFGEHQAPAAGFPVEDATGTVPHYYELGRADLKDAEHELWQRFWWYTTHREDAKKDGVEVAHGQAPFTKADTRLLYEIVADNRGNLSVRQKL